MISGLMRTLDNVLGRGEVAVTVPPLDGAFRPNRKLDEANTRSPLDDVDCLAVVAGELLASAGNTVYALDKGGDWQKRHGYENDITCIASLGDGGLAVALSTGEIVLEGNGFGGRKVQAGQDVRCITAIIGSGPDLYVANGSATNDAGDWQLDLMQRNASGSIWRVDLGSGRGTKLADGLAWPAGLAVDDRGLVCSEAWRHRLVRVAPGGGSPQVLYEDLPGYPGRLSPAADGYWLSVFAPRSQLVEFVLREPAYRMRMVAAVPRQFWIAPKLRSGRSFYEPLQGGGVKHLGMLKPWAPTMSAGLCVKLDRSFQPEFSLHSRADGATHGVTSVAEYRGQVFAAARGDGVVVSVPLEELGEEE